MAFEEKFRTEDLGGFYLVSALIRDLDDDILFSKGIMAAALEKTLS